MSENSNDSLYEGREQSLVKHEILKNYLLRFALIIGRHRPSITYVDCFSGPWKSKSDSYEDTSFAIAISQLRGARDRLAESGKTLKLRAYFIEEDRAAFSELEEYVASIDDVEIQVRNSRFEDSVDDVLRFIASDNRTFPFIFIDPLGWTGFGLNVIRRLLELRPCEVLINFMTKDITRFINNEASKKSFEDLFGNSGLVDVRHLKNEDRIDEIVFRYRDVVCDAGGFTFSGVAGVLNPLKNRSHFHLLYLTRHYKGLEVFKDAEKKSMTEMERARALAEYTNDKKSSNQPLLFPPEEAPESQYFRTLRNRYLERARVKLEHVLLYQGQVAYDDAWAIWLRYPMVWESDLKEWITLNADQYAVDGMGERQRVPKFGQNNIIRRL